MLTRVREKYREVRDKELQERWASICSQNYEQIAKKESKSLSRSNAVANKPPPFRERQSFPRRVAERGVEED
jgi:hypothetical protein